MSLTSAAAPLVAVGVVETRKTIRSGVHDNSNRWRCESFFEKDKQRAIRTAFFNFASISNQQVTVPTTIRMLRIIREDAKKDLSAKLVHTNFILGGGGQIGKSFSPHSITNPSNGTP